MDSKKSDLIARIGGPGSYSDMAVRQMFGEGAKILRCGSFRECLEATSGGRAGRAVIPTRNSITGNISDVPAGPTVEEMASEAGLVKVKEYRLQVRHVLASRSAIEDVGMVYSKLQALDQCRKLCDSRGWLTVDAAPDGRPITDTSAAAKYVAQLDVTYAAAICSAEAAKSNGLSILMDRGVADKEDNHTVFFAYRRAAG